MKNQRSFTLIEVLMVITIIGLLASIILITTKGARERAKIAKSLNFAAQVHHVLGAYAVGIWDLDDQVNPTADASGYDNHGTITGATFTADTPSGKGYALDLDGAGDYVSVSPFDNLRGATQFTIAFWAKFDVPQDSIFWRNGGWLTEVGATQYRFRFNLDNDWRANFYINHIVGQWHHVVISWDGTWTKGYINGELKLDSNLDSAFSVMSDNSDNLYIGHRSAYFSGFIDDVRIYSEALSSAQIRKLYVEGAKKKDLAVENDFN